MEDLYYFGSFKKLLELSKTGILFHITKGYENGTPKWGDYKRGNPFGQGKNKIEFFCSLH
jgi:hypothetical protein